MAKRLAVLHTSFVFINVETMMNDLFRELLPTTQIIHFVDSSLLAHVMENGGVTRQAARRFYQMAQAAQDAGADLILSACSSVGPAVDAVRQLLDVPIVKIDDAMTERAVASGSSIGVLATVSSTLSPTVSLLQQKAQTVGKPVQIKPMLAQGAFEALMAGRRDEHDQAVLEAAKAVAPQADLIVLAQASMTRLAPLLAQETGLTVLASPRLCIESLRELLEQAPER